MTALYDHELKFEFVIWYCSKVLLVIRGVVMQSSATKTDVAEFEVLYPIRNGKFNLKIHYNS